MGKIILSCGHSCPERPEGFDIIEKTTDANFYGVYNSATYGAYCLDCFKKAVESHKHYLWSSWEVGEFLKGDADG